MTGYYFASSNCKLDPRNPRIKPVNKSVATRTVFTTQIWDVTGITQPRLKTAGKQHTT